MFVIDPNPMPSREKPPHVHVTAVIECGPATQLQLYRIPMFPTLLSAMPSRSTPPLDVRLLLFPVEDARPPDSTSLYFHSDPPVVLYDLYSEPQLYRLGALQPPDPDEPPLRVLLPAERFGGTLGSLQHKLLFWIEGKWAAFQIDGENSQLSVKTGRLTRPTDWQFADDGWKVLGVVPVHSSTSHLHLNTWRGTAFISNLSSETHGEVRMYSFMD